MVNADVVFYATQDWITTTDLHATEKDHQYDKAAEDLEHLLLL